MTSVKKDSRQRKPLPQRLRLFPSATTLSGQTRHHVDGSLVITNKMIIEIDMENDTTTDTSRVRDSISSVSVSARQSMSTLSTIESQLPPYSSLSRANSAHSSFSRITSNTSLSRIASPPSIQSPAPSSIALTSKYDSNYMVTTDNNNPNRCKIENINKRNKRKEEGGIFQFNILFLLFESEKSSH